MNDELVRKWKEVVLAKFNAVFRHLPRELENIAENLNQDSWSPG
jgi:hypothetical protein